ncbi:MAG: Deoxyguanosinetriphosphate triphosphohydrolase-like protein [Chlamydiae bacterium]|nr:Deoxyguanosinetriphosphate triphosphohydrolase-like protein [Chlamydiota bacterium]
MKIYDSVHGFIHFNDLESALIDTEVFQRLRYIHQLGISYMVYPGGTHTRFEHSLGAMHLASQIFDQVGREEDRDYWRQMIRFAALCHDLGHLPFSHVAESRLLGPAGHEKWTLNIIESKYLEPIWEKAREVYPGKPVEQHVAMFALGEENLKLIRPEVEFSPWERIYAQIITGDFFGSDRIDYLLRDARATGLSYGLFDYVQLIEMLAVVPDERKELALGVEENGIASCEALLLARHFMQRRVYQYPTARAYSFHMARFMEILYGDPKYFSSVENYLSMSEPEVLCAMQKAQNDPSHPGHQDAASLIDRKKRFQAIGLTYTIGHSDLESYKKKLSVPDRQIHWELADRRGLKYGLSLPIKRKDAQIIPASEFSEIAIPATKKNWLYLAPEYDFAL